MNLESKGKSKGQHPHNKLDAKWIKKNHIDAGFYADGEGLYLKVDASGARRWVQRLMINSKRVDMGLGSAYLVSLADARVIARNNRAIARSGGDPLEAKRHSKEIPTFKEASYAVHALNLPTWSSDKHAKQWMQALENYVFDHFGSKRIDKITNADLMNVLALIWTEKPQTAKRIKQRIGLVLKWSIAKGFRVDNPASTIQIGLPSHKNVDVIPRKSLPYDKVSEAIKTIKNSDTLEVTKLAFEFLILTATRSGDTRGAKWSEFEGDLWSIPSKRMKMKKAHRVPLSPRCVEILELAKTYKDDSGLVFSDNGKPLLDSALS